MGAGRNERHLVWEWRLAASPEQLWPLVADTDRFDRDTGLPPVRAERWHGGVLHASTGRFGLRLPYEQEPFTWSRPHRFAVRRRFRRGPVADLAVAARLEPDGAGTHLTYEVRATPRGPLGALAVDVGLGRVAARRFDRTFRAYDRRARGDLAGPEPAPALVRGGEARLVTATEVVVAAGTDPGVAAHLADVVRSADDRGAGRIRPFALADTWGTDRGEVLDACLEATRAGMLALRWDVLCPTCEVAKASVPTLDTLPAGVHCETCRVDVATDLARSVELTFSPSPAVRKVDAVRHCIGGPGDAPRVVLQQVVPAGGGAVVGPLDEPGAHRLRAAGRTGTVDLTVADHPGPVAGPAVARLDEDGWSAPDLLVTAGGEARVENATPDDLVVLVERTTWRDQAATGAQVTAHARFRDLFADEVLRPGARVSVGPMSVLFTDLCASTRLYQEVGDAVAFGLVLDHFEVLEACVVAEGGTVVKTIGDAVMAVFSTPVPAVRAVLAAQRDLAEAATPKRAALQLKAGVHHGPCIAVTLNDRLDYFGSTVNQAARLQGRAGAGEVVVSEEVRRDPEMADLLAAAEPAVRLDPLTAELAGFARPFDLWRLRPA